MVYEEDKTFDKVDFTLEGFPQGEYEACVFTGCNFSAVDISGTVFSECEFIGCNLSTAKLSGTSFRDVEFADSKLLGLRFYDCTEFLLSMDFANCQLDLASFHNLKLKSTNFKDCSLNESDFTGANLTKAKFDNCDLRGATFDASILEGTDFRTAFNYAFDPEANRIKGAKFVSGGLAGLLAKYDIEIE